ncbi:Fic family protein [Kribbella sp. VKM Ac-2568]|uniref:Fic family protein n=1 Tax=Kribbella sp. VKM Ac-2568 TaxID=2512219 RepID=UPI00104E0127|nr:Fic family protein [Kribbella sp. VKM Ac-2568]
MDQALEGSPYLLEVDEQTAKQLQKILSDEEKIAQTLDAVRKDLAQFNLNELGQVQRTREVYESNAIEGVGPDLRRTWEILTSDRANDVSEDYDRHLFTDAIVGDPDMVAVLGLDGARVLAQRLRDGIGAGRTLAESDIRSLHQMVCAGEDHAGSYKRWHVRIAGENSHEPHLPIDVSPAMFELTEWFAKPMAGSATLRAAAAHAWLTHIHPFEDGNGRIARLLANFALGQAGLPPAIVKHASQRGEYLDALRLSDTGGDILPLASLFQKTIKRYAREVGRPSFVRRVFQEELQSRGNSFFDWWSNQFLEFASQLNGELALSGMRVDHLGMLDLQSFRLIQARDSTGNTWFEFVRNREDREILIWFGYPSETMRGRLSEDLLSPSLYFSVPHGSWNRFQPYRKARPVELSGLTEVMIAPDMNTKVYAIRNGQLRIGGLSDGAAEICSILVSGLKSGLIHKRSENVSR